MQHLSTTFCGECGLENDANATHCIACQHPLVQPNSINFPTPPVVPISIVSLVQNEVMTGSSLTFDQPEAPIDVQPGMIVAGRYQIEKEIGRGGFSIVYRAVALDDPGWYVAIKRILLSTLTPRQVIDATETFNREVALLSLLKGENGMPALYEHLKDAENWYLVMQYIPGQTLEDYLRGQPGGYITEEATITIGIKLAQILWRLHERQRPIIFRDVKPANIMITPDQELYLIDFGIARHFARGKMKDTTPLGSPGYASPEQYGRAQTDQRSDSYSLGATLQTLYTGRDPLELAAGEPSRNPTQPSPALRRVFGVLLSSEVTQRPSDMVQVQTLLEGALPQSKKDAPTTSYTVLQSFFMGVIYGMILVSMSALRLSAWSYLFVIGLVPILFIVFIVSAKWFRKKHVVGPTASWRLSFPGFLVGSLTVYFGVTLVIWLWSLGWKWFF